MSCLTILSSACTLSAPAPERENAKIQICLAESGPSQVCPSEVRPSQVCASEVRPSEVCLTEICPTKVGLSEVCPSEGCLSEVCFSEVCSSKVGLTEVCASEVCLSEVCPFKVRLAEVCPSEVCSFFPLRCATKAYALSKSFRDQFCSSWILLFDPIHLVRLAQALILMRADLPAAGQTPCTIHPVINVFWVSRCPDNLEQGHYGSHVLRL